MPELLTRSASLAKNTYNPATRTCEAVISTGSVVTRYGVHPGGRGAGPYNERLDVRGADLSRLPGAPVLLDHRAHDSSARVGVVQSVRRDRGELVAVLRFSGREDVAPLLQDIQDGLTPQISIGYEVTEWIKDA